MLLPFVLVSENLPYSPALFSRSQTGQAARSLLLKNDLAMFLLLDILQGEEHGPRDAPLCQPSIEAGLPIEIIPVTV